ncbi:saccharolysin (oligopeptidase) [Scheffersomyces stipitis CBS 6054]|uniref:Saccharolysin (Oligopeptidase) n=1 Tax=Scheffersomyces stipitis (strain ATCC 58785 / CBS 6054 / NBRC 10063 / NRRL Y-11545) TaxID=322104 RepID=A3GFY2_PICST|nr:saccharolysin (oligopeptidase) [Scheffersomyces stipitis CBS 6054]EAZ63424.2 saccharolysin (oligopeptidase) [Scheffersomyces stipitis CBS 6054]
MTTDFIALASKESYPLWNHTVEDLERLANQLVNEEKETYDYIATIENPTIENVVKPYARYSHKNALLENQITFYQYVSASKDLRDASTRAEEQLEQASIEQSLRVDVFQVFNKLYESIKDENDIEPETKRLVDKVVKYYKRNGLALPEEQREEIKRLKKELSTLSVKFSKNMNEEKDFILFTTEELAGVPLDVVDQYEKVEEDGVQKHKMTFKYPDLHPVLKHATNQETRKRAFIANQNKCPANAEILDTIIRTRFELAKKLGYSTYSEYVLEDRMAKTQKNVLDFLYDLKSKLVPLGQKEIANMKEFKNKDLTARGLEQQDKYYIWDSNFYNELLLEKEYKVDNTKISEYFPMDATIDKMLGFYETLFDMKFVRIDKPADGATWHEDVKQFAVYQNIKYGEPKLEFMGWIYFDLHPREGKYSHAANFGIGPGYLDEDGVTRHTPVTTLVCNFTKPTAEKPSLLKHDEVTTFFHELGHGVHNILSKTKYGRFHGTHVERDFVETPSQMLEFWTWSKNELRNLSSHFQTGEPINDELIDQLIKSKHVNTGLFNLRQLHFGLFDMKLHTTATKEELDELDLTKEWNEMRDEIALVDSDHIPTKGYSSFGHIAGGYESGYYGYLYSSVYSADIYYSLFKKDPMNVENGIRYRDIILKRGGSREIIDNLVELLGRQPNSDAFLEEIFGGQQ